MRFNQGRWRARNPAQQVALAVRILDGAHWQDVRDRAVAELGDRANQLGPLDMTRNTLRSYVQRVNRAHEAPSPFVDDLGEPLAVLMGDQSARTTVERYGTAGGRPMPSPQVQASREAMYYRIGAGYAGVLLGWSERAQQVYLEVVKPDALDLTYASHDPLEPTVVRHNRLREWRDLGLVPMDDVYDLTDLDAPTYRVEYQGGDVTAEVLGQTYIGDDYGWRFEDGRPYHRLVTVGDPHHPYATAQLVEATLSTCVLWTHWHAGVRDAGHPQRNVRGLTLLGMDTDADTGGAGYQTGPETVLQWTDLDPDRPGTHWQDGPGFDPEAIGRAIRDWELTAMSSLGLPVGFESTGGEPLEHERRALDALVARTYPDARRLDSEILRRAAALVNRHDLAPATVSETPYGCLYRDEVAEALAAAVPPAVEPVAPTDDDAPPPPDPSEEDNNDE